MSKEKVALANRLFQKHQVRHLESVVELCHNQSIDQMLDCYRQHNANAIQQPWISSFGRHHIALEEPAICELMKQFYNSDKVKMLQDMLDHPDLFNILPPLVKIEEPE